MAASSRSAFRFQGSNRSSSWASVRPETVRSSTSVSHVGEPGRGLDPVELRGRHQARHDRPVASPRWSATGAYRELVRRAGCRAASGRGVVLPALAERCGRGMGGLGAMRERLGSADRLAGRD
jgi:hypothetical protein